MASWPLFDSYIADQSGEQLRLLLDRAREGTEVIIEEDSNPVAVLRPAVSRRGRLLSESIALAEAHAKEPGYTPILEPDFAADLQEITNSHRVPLNPPEWE